MINYLSRKWIQENSNINIHKTLWKSVKQFLYGFMGFFDSLFMVYGSYMQQLHIYYKIIYKDYFKHIFQKITFGELV